MPQWSNIELNGDPPVITLWPGETKSGHGRTLPILSGEMLETLQQAAMIIHAKYENGVFTALVAVRLAGRHSGQDSCAGRRLNRSKAVQDLPIFGMWADRDDIADGTSYQNALRSKRRV